MNLPPNPNQPCPMKVTKPSRRLCAPFFLWCLAAAACGQSYVSPFQIALTNDIAAWTTDFAARTAAVISNSSLAPASWYSHNYGSLSYGPLNPQLYSSSSTPNPGLVQNLEYDRGAPVFDVAMQSRPGTVDPQVWQQQRLLYAASQLIGTHYQHLHLPQFDPAQANPTFPWSPVSTNALLQTTQDLRAGQPGTVANPYQATYGSPQPGIDCTDFSAYVYNLALGVQMHSGTPSQVTFSSGTAPATNNTPQALVLDAEGNVVTPQFFLSPNYGLSGVNEAGSLDGVISQLLPGDLLYMKGAGGAISHVVMWLGEYGTGTNGSPSGVPLVISSHDNTPAIFDTTAINMTNGLPLSGTAADHLPPPGVQILPFSSENWFYQDFSLAMRVVPEPSAGWLLGTAAAVLFAYHRLRRRFAA